MCVINSPASKNEAVAYSGGLFCVTIVTVQLRDIVSRKKWLKSETKSVLNSFQRSYS